MWRWNFVWHWDEGVSRNCQVKGGVAGPWYAAIQGQDVSAPTNTGTHPHGIPALAPPLPLLSSLHSLTPPQRPLRRDHTPLTPPSPAKLSKLSSSSRGSLTVNRLSDPATTTSPSRGRTPTSSPTHKRTSCVDSGSRHRQLGYAAGHDALPSPTTAEATGSVEKEREPPGSIYDGGLTSYTSRRKKNVGGF